MSDQYPSPFGGQPSGGFPGAGYPSQSPSAFPQSGAGFPAAGARPAPAAAAEATTRAGKKGGKDKRAQDKPPTKRLVSRQFVLAGIFAVAAGGALWTYLTNTQDTTFVVRAQADISAGTPVNASLLEAVEMPSAYLEPGAFHAASKDAALKLATDKLGNVVAEYPLAAKTQIRAVQFGTQATLGQGLQPNERLVSVHAAVASSVAGTLAVGDKVDIVGAADGWTKTVATSVPIVSIAPSEDLYSSIASAQTTDKTVTPSQKLPGDPVPGIYVVKVPADLVPALVNWDKSSTLSLVYRGPDATDATTSQDVMGSATAAPKG